MPPRYVLQAPGTRETHGPEEATLTSVLRYGAQEARRLGLITQEQWHRYHRSGEAAGLPSGSTGSAHMLRIHISCWQRPWCTFL